MLFCGWFWSFAGAWAHHEGLRRLKPCQFRRTVYWHCHLTKSKLWCGQLDQPAVHGQGTEIADVPGLASCILQLCNFYLRVNLEHEWFLAECKPGPKLIKILYIWGVGALPCKQSRMQCTGMLQEGFSKVNCFTIILSGFVREKQKLHRSEADFRMVLKRL